MFDIVAWCVIGLLLVLAVTLILVVGGLPGKIARRRGHPHADAVAAAGWIGLAVMGLLWPVAFVWAFLPYPAEEPHSSPHGESAQALRALQARLEAVETALTILRSQQAGGRQ